MRTNNLKSARQALAAIMATGLLSLSTAPCDPALNEAESAALNSTLVLNQVPPPSIPAEQVAPNCYNERFTQPAAEISRKIDILFVADTSGSLDEERAGIASGIDSFVGQLPSQADYRIGVMLAHSSKSQYAGALYRSATNEPYVLASDSMSQSAIRTALGKKLTVIKTDTYSDGGEEGLYSLTSGLSAAKLAESRSRGFFRTDAALAIVFISDEQDICYDYPAGITPVPDLDKIEPVAKARDCAGITPQSVVDKLKAVQGDRPLLVSGLLYIDNDSHPHKDENEKGYGWIDTIRAGNGVAVDLANGHYNEGLSTIGQMATVRLNLVREFPISRTGFDVASVQAKVDGVPAPNLYDAANNRVNLTQNAGGSLSVIDIGYCDKPAPPAPSKVSLTCSAGQFVPKAQVKVGLSIDQSASNEGNKQTILNGFNTVGYPATVYDDAQIASGKPAQDGVTVLVISRKVINASASEPYVQGVKDFVAQGGSLIGEYDGAALFFNSFAPGPSAMLGHMSPPLGLFTGDVSGGGSLLPLEQSRAYITDPYDPITEGMPASFLQGIRSAFSITNYDGEWLHQSASFISTGFQNQVPEGTYPAVLSGRCGGGRVVLFTMSHFNVMGQDPFKRMMKNALRWSAGL